MKHKQSRRRKWCEMMPLLKVHRHCSYRLWVEIMDSQMDTHDIVATCRKLWIAEKVNSVCKNRSHIFVKVLLVFRYRQSTSKIALCAKYEIWFAEISFQWIYSDGKNARDKMRNSFRNAAWSIESDWSIFLSQWFYLSTFFAFSGHQLRLWYQNFPLKNSFHWSFFCSFTSREYAVVFTYLSIREEK